VRTISFKLLYGLVIIHHVLIGEFGAALVALLTDDDIPLFQSPPHRGVRCGPRASLVNSPLYTGFQSPPHRGVRCGASLCQRPPLRRHISVPSSSGSSVRRGNRRLRGRDYGDISVPSSSGSSVRPSNLPCNIAAFPRAEEFIFSQQPELLQIAPHLRNSLPYIVAVVPKLATDAACAHRRGFRHLFVTNEAPNLVDGRNHLLP
jgi:hypothetical protein